MKSLRQLWKVSWRLGVCLLLLFWIFQAIFYNEGRVAWEGQTPAWNELTRSERWHIAWSKGPPQLWHTLQSMDLAALLLSIFLMLMTILLGLIRWQMILKVHGLDMPLGRLTQISLVAHFFNSFLLGSAGGDLFKAYYVARETHHKKTEAVVTVLVDRVLGMFSLLLFACLMMLPNRALIMSSPTIQTLALLVVAMTVGCAAFLAVAFWGGVSKTIPSARGWLRKLPKGAVLERSLEAFRVFGRDRTFLWRILPVSVLLNVVIILHFVALLRGFHIEVSLTGLSVVVPMVTSIAALPISPSGLGVRENLYVFMLAPLGVAPTQALLVSLIGYGTSLFWSAVGGLMYLTLKDREHLEELNATEESSA